MHAGELETSVLLAAYPDFVRDGWDTADHHAPDRRYLSALGISAYTDTGVIGQPSQATKEKGLGALNHLGAAAGTLIGLLVATHD
jgi:creatinine amidohydrolase